MKNVSKIKQKLKKKEKKVKNLKLHCEDSQTMFLIRIQRKKGKKKEVLMGNLLNSLLSSV